MKVLENYKFLKIIELSMFPSYVRRNFFDETRLACRPIEREVRKTLDDDTEQFCRSPRVDVCAEIGNKVPDSSVNRFAPDRSLVRRK